MNSRTLVIALIALSVVALTVIVGGIILALNDTTMPEFLVAIGGTSVGALAGIVTAAPPGGEQQ